MQMAQRRQHSDILRAVPTTAENCVNCERFKVKLGVARCVEGLIRKNDRYGAVEKFYRLGYYFARHQRLRQAKDWGEAQHCPMFENMGEE